MGNSFSAAKTLIIPALISLILYLLTTYLLIPLYTRYRTRYSYIPVPLAPSLDSISSRTSSIRARIQGLAGRFLVPSTWRRRMDVVTADEEEEGLDFEEGEELGQVRGGQQQDGRGVRDDVRRLSRDLEEGFMDDSDDEEEQRRR